MPKAIIVGASSGIGRALAMEFSRQGYALGLCARRVALLESLKQKLPGTAHIAALDVDQPEQALAQLKALIATLGGMDVIVLNAGISLPSNLKWEIESQIIKTNVSGFVALAEAAFDYFKEEHGGQGQLVGISSIASLRGARRSPAYNASKAFISRYMEGLRHVAAREGLKIMITDIRPGFVDTDMIKDLPYTFWVVPVAKAARQIYQAIHHKRRTAYVSKRWNLVAWALRVMPESIFHRIV